jgi:hypothetical protein
MQQTMISNFQFQSVMMSFWWPTKYWSVRVFSWRSGCILCNIYFVKLAQINMATGFNSVIVYLFMQGSVWRHRMCCCFVTWVICSLLKDRGAFLLRFKQTKNGLGPDDEGTTFLQSVWSHSLNNTTSHRRRPESSETLLWGPHSVMCSFIDMSCVPISITIPPCQFLSAWLYHLPY